MLYIITPKGTHDWHIGQKVSIPKEELNQVIEVQADGDELEHIRYQFQNIPHAKVRVCNWYGDIAKFIVNNLV